MGWSDLICIECYMEKLVEALLAAFGHELLYVGLQGSYLRGEATESSDIDAMVILETADLPALARYREVIESLGDSDKACGFLCGRADMAHWNTLEIPHLLHATKDYYGTLADFMPPCTEEDLRQFLRLSLGNLLHELTHRYIHRPVERSYAALADMHRPVFFILQNLLYRRDCIYPETRAALTELLTGEDKAVWDMLCREKNGEGNPETDLRLLHDWCRNTLQTL